MSNQSHKSPSSQKWIAQRERREILETRRASAQSQSEGTAYRFISAMPKHPKAGRIYSNANSNRTITGNTMPGKPFNPSRVPREISRPLAEQNWELLLSYDQKVNAHIIYDSRD